MDLQGFRGLQEAYDGVYGDLGESSLADLFSDANKKNRDEDERITKAQAKRIERSQKLAASATGDSTVPTSSSPRKRKPGEALKAVQDTLKRFDDDVKNTKIDEDLDLYDLILAHLLDEGYASTSEAAEVIMVNMSEGKKTEFAMQALGAIGKAAKRVNDSDTAKRLKKRAGRFALHTLLGMPFE